MNEAHLTVLMEEPASSSSSTTSSSSTSDSTSDDDFNLLSENDEEDDILFPLLRFLLEGRERQHVQNFLHTVHAKSSEEFKADFRLERAIVNILLESLETNGFLPTHTFGKQKKPAELCLLMTLWFLGNKESHRLLANLFDISLSSVFRIVRRVIKWLIALVPQFIKWPEDDDIARISQTFQDVAGIHSCIGVIDGSHIYINQPEENGRDYFNRKQHYSILLQAVVDCNMHFTNVYCGDPGSFHDARMLRRSDLFVSAEQNRERIFPNNTFLIGDKGYSGVAETWLVCPFRNNGNLTAQQEEFNKAIAKTRVVVERAFGLLKSRFRLLQSIPLRNIGFTVHVIVACCVLHNICLVNGDAGEGVYNNEVLHQWNDEFEAADEPDGRNNQQRCKR